MTPEQVAEVLLVRAVEEAAPEALSPEARIDALEAAGDLDDERAWFARRAGHLARSALDRYRPLLRVQSAFAPALGWNLALPAALGAASNALGPAAHIHVLYNPLVLLVAWNLALYLGLALLAVRPRPPALGWIGQLARRAAERLWLRAARAGSDAGADFAAAGTRFVALWRRAAAPWLALRTRRVLHLAALGLALGAIAGMYVRGLFFEYEMVWRSTFVREPERVAEILRLALGPARAVLGMPPPSAADAVALLAPGGVAAAPWIHALACTALLGIVLPRVALAASAARRERRAAAALDLAEPYFTAVLADAREIQIDRIKAEIGAAVRSESARFADELARFVCEGLYDRRIAPLLEAYRSEGGSVAALETQIRAAASEFEPELAEHTKRAEHAFEEGLSRDVLARVRPDLVLPAARSGRLAPAAWELPAESVRALGGDVSSRLARDFAGAVTLAVAAVAGTVSGGFGSHLGAAVLVVLLHTSGPIGFLVGALGGALAAGGALLVGRERVGAAARNASLPGPVVRLVLRRARFERLVARGRERCAATVREAVAATLAPLTDQLADQVWSRVKPLLARRREPQQGV